MDHRFCLFFGSGTRLALRGDGMDDVDVEDKKTIYFISDGRTDGLIIALLKVTDKHSYFLGKKLDTRKPER